MNKFMLATRLVGVCHSSGCGDHSMSGIEKNEDDRYMGFHSLVCHHLKEFIVA